MTELDTTTTAGGASPPASPVQRVLIPLDATTDQAAVLLPATVLASWLDAPIQIVCDDDGQLERYRTLSAGLGVPAEAAVSVAAPLDEHLAVHAQDCRPCLIIAQPTPVWRRFAARSPQPVLLVADRPVHRFPGGPLAVELTGADGDLDALALTAVLSRRLDQPARLVVTAEDEAGEIDADAVHRLSRAVARLRQMGCDTGIDAVRAHGLAPLVLVARSRQAIAAVVPASRLGDTDLIDRAIAQGVNVLVAPDSGVAGEEAGRAATGAPVAAPPITSEIGELSDAECLDLLGRHAVARLGYVEDGWPTVVPVNYRVAGGEVFIRTLAGGKLRAAERGDVVCLELDGIDEELRSGWSVVAHGHLEVISDPAALRHAWANDPHPFVESDDWQWLRLIPFSLGGRRVEPGPTGG